MADEPVINEEEEFEEDESDQEEVAENNEEAYESRPNRPPRRQPSQRQQGQRQQSGPGGYRGRGGSARFQSRRKVCSFCVDKVKTIDWKNLDMLRRYMNNNGSIRARRKTGTCAKHQRQLAVAVKRARHMALTPFTDEHVRLYGGK